jgi:Flp pilus assembly protein TadG
MIEMHGGDLWRQLRGAEGGSVVETALSAMVLLMLVFGIMETSLALYSYHFTSEAAREGTRYAMVRGSGCSGAGAACPATASDVQTFVKNISMPGINPAEVTVQTVWPTSGSACTPSSNPCNNAGNLVEVTVEYAFPWSIPFVPASTLHMTSTSEMVISQ